MKYNFDCFALDASCQSWLPHSHSTLPTSCLQESLCLFSGYDGISFFLPTGSTEWLDGPQPKNIATCVVAISASKFLVIGGSPDPKLVEEFDTATSSWTSWPPLEQGRLWHSCMRAGNNMVIAGGVGVGPGRTFLSSYCINDNPEH